MPDPLPPPPARSGSRLVAAPDVEAVHATLRFDAASRTASAEATVTFSVEVDGSAPALDLRQRAAGVRLDGASLGDGAFLPVDLGGGPLGEMRIVDAALPAGRHLLALDYPLETPAATGAEPIGWVDGGVRFDLWMSDLEPGRYLEMWVPAPLCHDRFSLSVDIEVTGTPRPHLVVANGAVTGGGNRWRVSYPATFTSLSPMLVLLPADEVEERRGPVVLAGRPSPLDVAVLRPAEVDADLDACRADVGSWLGYLAARYGPWAHGDTFTAFLWAPGRGMEYDGATTASLPALEHEVFHSWFGRGVKPAHASDGWIDEAWTSWATASSRSAVGRFSEEPLDLDEEPVLLRPPHPWSRYTPRESYDRGARLFAGVAALAGGAGRLRSAMGAWYRENAGGFVTTDGLEAHLRSWCGESVGPLWDRYVHGRG